jgi:hypothetical protein
MTRRPKTNPIKKRNQHHVWQEYLRAWSIGGQLYCLMDGEVIPTGTRRIAVERDFYKIGKLTEADIALIRLLLIDAKGVHPLTREPHEDFLKQVTMPDLFEGMTPALDNLVDTFRTNELEDVHMGIERSFFPLLKRALNKDISFYSDDQSCRTLFHFLASQHGRTKGVKEKMIEISNGGLDASRIWAIMSCMFAVNVGWSLFLERKERQLVLVENLTDVAFITGDQPIVNLHGDGEKPPETLSFYYPISPHLALLLPEVDEEPIVSTTSLTSAQVSDLNSRMAAASHRQVFAQSRSALEPYARSNSPT